MMSSLIFCALKFQKVIMYVCEFADVFEKMCEIYKINHILVTIFVRNYIARHVLTIPRYNSSKILSARGFLRMYFYWG